MAGRGYGGLRRAVAVVVCLAGAAASLSGSVVAGTAGQPLRVLQLNLCDSGLAGCYTGRSVAQAQAVIRADAPDVVTLNEVCRDDVSALRRTLVDTLGLGTASAFRAARDRRTGGPFRCRDGQPYGIGLLVRVPAPAGRYSTSSGIYPTQALDDPEERAWLCMGAEVYACTTHLASTSRAVALTQCGYLLDVVVPAMRGRRGYPPTVLGGDLNLVSGGSPDVRSCVPPGYPRADDGAVQQIVATAGFRIGSARTVGMRGTTDHPGLLVALTTVRVFRPPARGDRP